MPPRQPPPSIPKHQFLKLGGSLITDKSRPHTARTGVLSRLANEIASARDKDPNLKLILGHGSGSFGHVPAKRHNTRQGVHTPEEWIGFVEVWREASTLNRFVIEALSTVGLPAIAFPPSASVSAHQGEITEWNLVPLLAALDTGLLPVVFGDVIFDTARGGTILSTEDLFAHLARQLKPKRLLLAGREPGVWGDYPTCTQLIKEITPDDIEELAPFLAGSPETDVTGGMLVKVQQSLNLAQEIPNLEVLIFSGETTGAVEQVLLGKKVGTIIRGYANIE